jgi:hypothetical protein
VILKENISNNRTPNREKPLIQVDYHKEKCVHFVSYLDCQCLFLSTFKYTLSIYFMKFSPPPFFMALEVFKENSKKMNMISRKDDQNLRKTFFQKIYR